jgi:hypothetical protein
MDERIKRTPDSSRESRKVEDQPRAGADQSVAGISERRKMFRDFIQEALPTPPAVPGWHFVWLSTTSQYDPIYKRVRMGYEPVKAEELPGYENYRVKSGEHEGLVSVNEMLLFKIPQEIYQEIMEEYHHNMPNEEEERLRSNAVSNEADSNGRRLGGFDKDDEGFRSMRGIFQTPVFN